MSKQQPAKNRETILDEIMRYHRQQLPKIKRQIPLADLRAMAGTIPPPTDFYQALSGPGVSLIAECKKASPSKGLLVSNYDALEIARQYIRAGARGISVLTDNRHFQGSLDDLRNVKAFLTETSNGSLKAAVLRKDFIFDPYQVYESRAAGADALLLIAAVLSPGKMSELLALTRELGMSALVEVHTPEELQHVLPFKPRIVGVNNRNLKTFEVDFENTARLRRLIPQEIIIVGESGIKTAADVRRMAEIGVDAILVGESLVKSKNVFKAAQTLVRAGTAGNS